MTGRGIQSQDFGTEYWKFLGELELAMGFSLEILGLNIGNFLDYSKQSWTVFEAWF